MSRTGARGDAGGTTLSSASHERSANGQGRFDIFLSYSRRDAAFAGALERALRAYTPPRDLPVPQRRLTVFRDEADMQGVELARALDEHVRQASKLAVLCSPDARASAYVNQEVASFVRVRGAGHLVPVLVRGLPNNEARAGQEAEMAFPDALTNALATPLAADFRGFRPRRHRIGRPPFEDPWHKMLADIYAEHGVSRAQIEGRERRRQARRRAIVAAATAASMVVLLSMTIWALVERREAIRQRNDAVSRQLAQQAGDLIDDRPDTALLLAAAAYRSAPTLQARGTLQASFAARPRLRAFLWGHTGDVASVAFSDDGRLVASGGEDDKRVIVYGTDAGAPLFSVDAHGDAVQRVAFRPGGRELISAGQDGGIAVWDVVRRAEIRRFGDGPEAERLETFALSPDGARLVTGDWSGALTLWNVDTGRRIGQVQPHRGLVGTVSFDAQGTVILSGSADGTAAVWDGSGTHPAILPGHGRGVQDAAVSPDGALLAVAFGTGVVNLWDVGAGRLVETLQSHAADHDAMEGASLSFAPDGRTLARTGTLTGRIALWDLSNDDRPQRVLDTGSELGIHAASWSRDGRRFAAVGGDGILRLWDTAGWQLVESSRGGAGCLAFSPDGATLATCGRDRAALWDVEAPEVVWQSGSHRAPVGTLRFSPDGSSLASASEERDIIVLDPRTRREAAAYRMPMPPGAEFEPVTRGGELRVFAFSPDGATIATGGRQGASFGEGGRRGDLLLWNVRGGDVTPLEGHPSGLSALAFTPDGRHLAAADGRSVRLWDLSARTARVISTSRGALCLAFNPDGTLLAAGSADDVLLWDLSGGGGGAPAPVALEGHERPVRDVRFSPDGATLISISFDGTARVWTIAPPSGATSAGAARHDADINSLAVAPDGRVFATGSRDRTVGVWDTRTGALRRRLAGHAASVESVAFDRSGGMLASADDNDRVIVWDVESGREVLEFRAGATRVAFSPRDPLLALAGRDGRVTVWDLAMDAWPESACRQANRNLTCEEWRQYMPDSRYQAVCPSLPAPADCVVD